MYIRIYTHIRTQPVKKTHFAGNRGDARKADD